MKKNQVYFNLCPIESEQAERMVTRAMQYIRYRRPYEYSTIEIFQDLLDECEGVRRAMRIN
jgi:hypothetical protein